MAEFMFDGDLNFSDDDHSKRDLSDLSEVATGQSTASFERGAVVPPAVSDVVPREPAAKVAAGQTDIDWSGWDAQAGPSALEQYRAGLPLVAAGAGALLGAAVGGLWGAASGAAMVGSAINFSRFAANRDQEGIAKAHLAFAVVAGAAAVYTGNKAYKSKMGAEVVSNMTLPKWLKKR